MSDDIIQLDEKFADEFVRSRMELFRELGEITDETDAAGLERETRRYYLEHINNDLISRGVLREGKLVCVGSLCMFSRLPYMKNMSGAEGYILNIYTSPPFRGNGLAGAVLDDIIRFSRENNIGRLWLDSSEQGKSLYAGRGFSEKGNELELFM